MAILKNINESGTNFDLLFKRTEYVTGYLKTKLNMIGALYAVHTDTAHTHFHIPVCNTRISDGSQISVNDLWYFKEHCSSVLRRYGLKPNWACACNKNLNDFS